MRLLTISLALLLTMVHAELWLSKGGIPRVLELQSQLTHQRTLNNSGRLRNSQLQAEVNDLKEGLEMVEEKARYELGMIKPNEIMVQLIAVTR